MPMPSTTNVWKPGIGLTLTKANLRSINEARATDNKSPIRGVDELLRELVDDNVLKQFKKSGIPPRYTRRAEALLNHSH